MTSDSRSRTGTRSRTAASAGRAHRPAATTRSRSPRSLARAVRAGLRVLLGAALVALAMSGAALPASADSGTSGGWVRLTHLSPDTPAVNVALTNLSDSKAVIKLSDVGYGDISPYQKVAAGRYVATMTPPGGGANATPAVSQPITVRDGKAYTVAAVGRNAELRGTVFDDDLTTPAKGKARIRLVQASVSADSLTVRAVGGPVLADDLAFASTTDYVSVPEGVWTLEITSGDGTSEEAKITARSGTVSTVLLLDRDGRPTATVVKDAAAAPSRPARGSGVETGGGGTATDVITPALTGADPGAVSPLGRAVSALVLAALAAAVLLTGSRRTRGVGVRVQPVREAAVRRLRR